MDQGGSVPLVHVAAFDWPSLPSSPPPASGHHSRDRRAGETCELNATRQLMARYCGRSMPYVRAIWLYSDVATTGHPFVTAMVLAGCSDQGHNFLTAAYDHVRSAFGRYTDLLRANKGVRIIHRSTDFYTVTKI